MSHVHVFDHPLIQHKLSILRDKDTGVKEFRELVSEIAMLMCFEATRDLPLEEVDIETPVAMAKCRQIAGKKLAIVPILRAGLGMVDGMVAMMPNAKVGHIGLYRDPETLEPVKYYFKMPPDIFERDVIIVDPMLATGGSAVSKELFAARIGASPVLDDGDFDVREGTFQIKVDGQTYTLSAPRKEDGGAYGKAELLTLFNQQLEEKLGAGTVEFAADGSLTVQGGAKVEIAKSAHADLTDPDLIKEAAKTDLALALGFAQGADNRTTADTALADLGISIPGCTTLGDLSGNLAFVDGRVVVTGTGITVVGDAATTEKLFGRPSLELGMTQGAAAAYVEGVNAVLYVDGDENRTERSSNSFTINGLNIELKETTDDYQVVNVSRGTDQIVDGIKGFMEEYNTLIEKLNGLIREEATYKSYAPLTSDQKKEMSDREVELWEQQAKTGLLRRDSAIESFLQSMRTAIYAKPTGSDIAIYDLGISTSSEWQDFGKLVLTADGEAKLRQMVESDPDAVVNLFTGEEGLAVRMDGILKSAANTSSASPGSLIRLAGWPGRASATDNDLYKRMQQIDDRIAALKRTYEKEKSRYWRQFNAMEQVVANMTSQSAWLTQQLGM